MKAAPQIAFALVITILVTAGIVSAQNYSVPHELRLEPPAKRLFPQYFGGRNRYNALIPETFFPIGWSRDGKFAFYIEPVDEACGCYFAELVIQDMRTDTVLWEFKYDQDDTYNDKGEMTGPGDIKKLWASNAKLFSEKLREHGIIASRSTLLGKTFTAAGRSYTARSTKKMGKNPDEDWPRVDIFTIKLTTPRLGSKTVYTADYTSEEYWFMLDAGLIGAIKSPYENRVAIIAMEAMRGYEGPPHTGNIRIVGADLTSGFGK